MVTLQYLAYTDNGTREHSCSSLLRAPKRQRCTSVLWSNIRGLKKFTRITVWRRFWGVVYDKMIEWPPMDFQLKNDQTLFDILYCEWRDIGLLSSANCQEKSLHLNFSSPLSSRLLTSKSCPHVIKVIVHSIWIGQTNKESKKTCFGRGWDRDDWPSRG
jgi:hypothetical protein